MLSEKDYVERLEELVAESTEEGWELTKKAAITTDPEIRNKLTEEAEATYKQPIFEIAQHYLSEPPTKKFLDEINKKIIEANINVFDLYRRVGRLDKAEELGQKTFKEAKKTGDISLIFRAGNFFSLVQSAEAYELMDTPNEDFDGALKKYDGVIKTFESMPLSEVKGKNAVMLYTNQGANYLNIVYALLTDSTRNIESELEQAFESTDKAHILLGDIKDENDRAVWKSNIHSNFGKIAIHKEDLGGAINHYEIALKESQKSDYGLQTAVIQTYLSHLFISDSINNFEKAKEHFTPVEQYLDNNDFGIYNFMMQPLVTELRFSFK